MILLLWLALGLTLGWYAGLWHAKGEREAKLRMRRWWRLVHRARDSELRTHRLWLFILLSSKAKRMIYRVDPRSMARDAMALMGKRN